MLWEAFIVHNPGVRYCLPATLRTSRAYPTGAIPLQTPLSSPTWVHTYRNIPFNTLLYPLHLPHEHRS